MRGQAQTHQSAPPDRIETLSDGTVLLSRTDPVDGFAGYLAFHGQDNPLAAGGLRVQRGLTAQHVVSLAEAMARKQRLLGLAVDGAKCGIDYDPRWRGKPGALRRFLGFLRPFLCERLSLGPDAGTSWAELEQLAAQEGLSSVKCAVARAQGLSEQETRSRLDLLGREVDGLTLGQRRAGHGLAHAGLEALRSAGGETTVPVRVGVQGFGTLGKAAAVSLAEAGLRVTAVADEHGCVRAPEGFGLDTLVAGSCTTELTGDGAYACCEPTALFSARVDLLVLAACEDALTVDQAASLPDCLRVVAVGANLGLNPAAEDALDRRGLLVVPDIVGGSGGSASMNALFGPDAVPSPSDFLAHTGAAVADATRRVLTIAAQRTLTPRAAALTLAEERPPPARARPYAVDALDTAGRQ